MIKEPGIYTISAEEYHSDPVEQVSLSSSIAKVMLNDSPFHAAAKHPRLDTAAIEEEKDIFDIGKAAHSLVLEGVDVASVLDFDSYRTAQAKAARDAARAAGKVPLLAHRHAEVMAMVESCYSQLKTHRDASDAFTDGKPEQTVIWFDGEFQVWCRARLDYLKDDFSMIDDYKSSGVTANPEILSRKIFNEGWDIQESFYRRGLKAVTGKDASFRFVAQETKYPYALSVIGLIPQIQISAEKSLNIAMERWADCLKKNNWPGYPRKTCWPEMPIYIQAQRERMEMEN